MVALHGQSEEGWGETAVVWAKPRLGAFRRQKATVLCSGRKSSVRIFVGRNGWQERNAVLLVYPL